jgi:hypothetical protein
VFYEDLNEIKKKQLLRVCYNPVALLRRFYRAVAYYSTRVVVEKRIR